MDSETPQTDAAAFTHQDAYLEEMRSYRPLVDAYFAQRLERERDEARREAESWRAFALLHIAGRIWKKKEFPWEKREDNA